MKTVKTTVTFKTKIKEFADNEGKYINFKKTFSRADCALTHGEHYYYNSDFFPSMLNKAVQKAINNKTWCRLSELPDTVTCNDLDAFLPTFTIAIEV